MCDVTTTRLVAVLIKVVQTDVSSVCARAVVALNEIRVSAALEEDYKHQSELNKMSPP